jgi:hypothetical protein
VHASIPKKDIRLGTSAIIAEKYPTWINDNPCMLKRREDARSNV